MEGLSGIHGPRDGEAERGESKRDQKYHEGHEQNLQHVEMYAGERSEDEEDNPLNSGESGAPENLAENDCGARDWGDQHREQESFFAVFNHRHHSENRGEEDDHNQGAGIEIIAVVLLTLASAGAKRGAESGADY